MSYMVKEIFNTLQGEGGRAGARSVFVRFAGCNLWSGKPNGREKGKGACAKWCDTDFVEGWKLTAEELLHEINERWSRHGFSERWVVITGGEPMLQLDEKLVHLLHENGVKVAIETNGSIHAPVVESLDWVCVSPKLRGDDADCDPAIKRGQELKVVLPGAIDSEGWTDDLLTKLEAATSFDHYFVQPQDIIDPDRVDQTFLKKNLMVLNGHGGKYKANLERCIQFVQRHPRWKLSLQQHKMIGLP